MIMIESARTRSLGFWPGRLSTPTSRMFLAPLIVTCCFGAAGSSRSVWLKLCVAASKISFWPTMRVPLVNIISAPKITSSLARNGSLRLRPDLRPLPRLGGPPLRWPRVASSREESSTALDAYCKAGSWSEGSGLRRHCTDDLVAARAPLTYGHRKFGRTRQAVWTIYYWLTESYPPVPADGAADAAAR